MGQGAALKTGIDYALRDPGMRQIVTFDSDGQHQVDDAAAMISQREAEGIWWPVARIGEAGLPTLFAKLAARGAAWSAAAT